MQLLILRVVMNKPMSSNNSQPIVCNLKNDMVICTSHNVDSSDISSDNKHDDNNELPETFKEPCSSSDLAKCPSTVKYKKKHSYPDNQCASSDISPKSRKSKTLTENSPETSSEELLEHDQPEDKDEGFDFDSQEYSNLFCCDKCSFTCKFYSRYKSHIRLHTGERPYACRDCGKGFSTKHSLTCHERVHSGEKPYHCEVCGKNYRESTHLNTHMRIHNGLKPFRCDRCWRGFARSSDLTRHIRIHSGEKPFKCSYCGKCFTQSNGLKYHLKSACLSNETAKNPSNKKQAGDNTKVTKGTENHSLDINKSKPHVCDICGENFAQKLYLKRHLKMHCDDKFYQCHICDKKFTCTSALARHAKTHTEEKPYKCDHCGKEFHIAENLQKHLLIHTGECPYACDICFKRFSHASHLQVHQRTHTGEKPFSCHVCCRHFSQSSVLSSHLKTHNVKSHLCSLCNSVFNSLSDLLVHSANHLIEDCSNVLNETKSVSTNTETD